MTIDHIAIRPGDADYDEARTTKAGTAEPAIVLRPRTPEEVAASIDHARAEGIPLAIRSGGHNALGFGNIDDGVVIDVSQLDQVDLLGDGRVRIGAGASWGPAAAALAEHGLAITSGDTISVGVGGLTQAGGIGWMVRKHGLTIDSLLAAEVVTAAGDVVRASATENADLFWALRGGARELRCGHRVRVPGPADLDGALRHDLVRARRRAPAAEELVRRDAQRPGRAEHDAGPDARVRRLPRRRDSLRVPGRRRRLGARAVANDRHGRRRGRQRGPYAEILEEAGPPPGVLPVIGNTMVESVDEPLTEAIATAYAAGGRLVFLRSLGGAFGRVDRAETAFAHRGAEALVVSAAFLPLDATDDQIAGAHAVWRTIGDQGVGSYAGFLGGDSAEDVATLWPADTLERLRQVKRTWDPENIFSRNFNVAP